MTHRGRIHDIPIGGGRSDRGDRREGSGEPSSPDPAPTTAEETRSAPSAEGTIDQLQRLQAEFANYRKRVERDRLETVSWAQRNLVEKLIPILEDLDRAMASIEGNSSPAAQGLALLHDKLHGTLAEAGLERISTVGETFDPARHEAVTTQPVEPGRVSQILAEIAPGFAFRGKLVRPARVQVGVEGEEAGFEDAG